MDLQLPDDLDERVVGNSGRRYLEMKCRFRRWLELCKISRLRKADSTFDKNQEKYHKFRSHLACIIVSRPTEDGRPEKEGKEVHSVEYFANLKLTSIQERLIEAKEGHIDFCKPRDIPMA